MISAMAVTCAVGLAPIFFDFARRCSLQDFCTSPNHASGRSGSAQPFADELRRSKVDTVTTTLISEVLKHRASTKILTPQHWRIKGATWRESRIHRNT